MLVLRGNFSPVPLTSCSNAPPARYMAPELFEGPEDDTLPLKTLASDVYAFGQVILEVSLVTTQEDGMNSGPTRP